MGQQYTTHHKCFAIAGKPKTSYLTQGEALVYADKQTVPLREYYCEKCQGWHLTRNIHNSY